VAKIITFNCSYFMTCFRAPISSTVSRVSYRVITDCRQLVCSALCTSAQHVTNRPSNQWNSHRWACTADRPNGMSWKLRHTCCRWACMTVFVITMC